MYNTNLNNYHLKPKNSTIYTPQAVSQFLFNLLAPLFPNTDSLIVDPGCGGYSLLAPWQKTGYHTLGIDNDLTSLADDYNDFLSLEQWIYRQPALILCNPPLNGMKPQLAPEVWLDKILELFGSDTPIILFAPIGLRVCNSYHGKRYQKFLNGEYPSISSIITLPRTIFPNVEFHTEILIFNISNLQPHYFFQPQSE